ncbi:MAG: YHS domain-containing protein [Actinomycetota bacterium]
MELTLEQLADRTGESVAHLEQWRAAGLIADRPSYGAEDAERARLVGFLVQRGFDVETIARADAGHGGLIERFLSLLYPSGRIPAYSTGELVAKTDLDPDLVGRVWHAAGLREHGDAAGDDDVDMLRALATAIEVGLPESVVLEMVRVYADSLRRVAEAEVRLFHFYVHERLRTEGLEGEELDEVTRAAGDRLLEIAEPAVLYFHRKGWASAMRDDLALHVAQEGGGAPVPDVPGTLSAAVVFVDLHRFTPLTKAMGDVAAAEVVERFSDIVRTAVGHWHGRVVKQIGDAFMLVFFEPRAAISCTLEIERRAVEEPQFLAVRSGAHWGDVLYREGDYVGTTVNVAARLEQAAGPHQFLVTGDMRRAAADAPEAEFAPLGTRSFKGLVDDIEIFEAQHSSDPSREKLADPVCGMELALEEVAARLEFGGRTPMFCSSECLQLFVANPERYSPTQ